MRSLWFSHIYIYIYIFLWPVIVGFVQEPSHPYSGVGPSFLTTIGDLTPLPFPSFQVTLAREVLRSWIYPSMKGCLTLVMYFGDLTSVENNTYGNLTLYVKSTIFNMFFHNHIINLTNLHASEKLKKPTDAGKTKLNQPLLSSPCL